VEGPVVQLGQVSSPTGNIWCTLMYEGIGCIVKKNEYDPLPRPVHCTTDWIDGAFGLGDRGLPERGSCQGDTDYGNGRPAVLPYGSTTLVENRACQSTESAMICWNTDSRHGFRLSRAAYRLF
jgi:hypothetical protein